MATATEVEETMHHAHHPRDMERSGEEGADAAASDRWRDPRGEGMDSSSGGCKGQMIMLMLLVLSSLAC